MLIKCKKQNITFYKYRLSALFLNFLLLSTPREKVLKKESQNMNLKSTLKTIILPL
jgi:hypothetical protein